LRSAKSRDTVAQDEGRPSTCAWCGAQLAGRVPESGFTIVRCASCGAYTTLPKPSDADLEAAYGTWYRPAEGRFGCVGDAVLRFSRASLARRVDRIAPSGPILDVGAGAGALIDGLTRRGRTALGIERTAHGESIRVMEIESVEGEWAAVVFWHSLEHLRRAPGALRHAAALLPSNGMLVVAAPNPGSLQAGVFGKRWFAWDLPRHLVHVPAATLLAGIERHGFQVVRVSHLRGGQVVFGWLHGLVSVLPGNPDLYDAIRLSAARSRPLTPARQIAILAAATALLPVATVCAAAEVLLQRGGTIYVEARRG